MVTSKFAGHTLCRPPKNTSNVIRLGLDGQWRDDNMQHGLAFIGQIDGVTPVGPDDAVIWVTDCKCKTPGECPLGAAMGKAADLGISSTTIERRRAYRKPKKPKRK